MPGKVGHDPRTEARFRRFGFAGRILDRLQTLDRIGDIGPDFYRHCRQIIARIGFITRTAAGIDRGNGHQGFLREFLVLVQIVAKRAAANGQHHVIDGRIPDLETHFLELF